MPVDARRIKALTHLLSEGTVATRPWLIANGFDRHAIDNLLKSDKLTSVAPGVYTRWNSKLSWEAVVSHLQQDLNLNLTIGGLTALDMQGFSHYLALGGKKTIHLYGTAKLPTWLEKVLPDVEFKWHSERELLGKNQPVIPDPQNDPLARFTKVQPWKDVEHTIRLSSPERAILEILLGIPNEMSFEHADQLMQGLSTLSPRSLQALLEDCDNKKVRRLFFWLAERHQHSWLGKLHPEKIDFGYGKRMLVKDGTLVKKYNITVPRSL